MSASPLSCFPLNCKRAGGNEEEFSTEVHNTTHGKQHSSTGRGWRRRSTVQFGTGFDSNVWPASGATAQQYTETQGHNRSCTSKPIGQVVTKLVEEGFSDFSHFPSHHCLLPVSPPLLVVVSRCVAVSSLVVVVVAVVVVAFASLLLRCYCVYCCGGVVFFSAVWLLQLHCRVLLLLRCFGCVVGIVGGVGSGSTARIAVLLVVRAVAG
jgi:hypothetical protein